MTIEEDNLVSQLQSAGKTVVHLGDDTWQALFPDSFNKMLSRPFDSFNVWDLHTVDDGVTAHLLPLLHPTNASSWDVIFAHYLGVDHAGHRYGPQHSAMAAKLKQMNTLIEDVMQRVDDETLLVVLGDHGMDAKGDHGGESDDEIQATLWMYAKKPAFGRVDYAAQPAPPASAADAAAAVPQIDLVPTLSLLLGLPIPFNNLGSPIDDAFAGSRVKKPNWQNLVDVNRITAAQIRRYQGHYADARGLDETHRLVAGTRATFDTAETAAAGMGRQTAAQRTAYQLYRDYERDVLRVCKSLWVTFDETSMRVGVALLAAALVVLFAYARAGSKGIATAGERTRISSEVLALASRGAGAGAVLGAAIAATGLLPIDIGVADAGVLGATALSITAASTRIFRFAIPRLRLPFPRSLWSLCAVLITLLPPLGFASNSYTIWEDRITLFLLTTFGVLAACSSLRQEKRADRILGFYHSCLFVVLGRVAAISRLCREEQMPFCKSTYYASASSSMSAAWQLAIPFIVALTLPAVIKSYYAGSASYEGSASFWLSVCFRFSLVLTAVTWVLDARDDSTAAGGSASAQAVGDMLASLDPEGSVLPSAKSLKRIRVTLAQLALGVGLVVGLTNYAWAKPCISVDSFRTGAEGKDEAGNSLVPSDAAAMLPPAAGGAAGDSAAAGAMPTAAPGTLYISILGWSNVYGTLYFFLVTAFALAIIQMQKPMGGGAIALQLWQVLSLLEILDTNGLTTSNNAIGPVVLGLLGSFHYFTTGHQATLSSIQWDAAFIPLRSVRYPWSPALIVLNTFGAQILSAVAVPLCVLWKRQLDARCLFGSSSADSDADDSSRGEQDEQQEQPAARVSAPARSSMLSILSDVAQAASTHILYHAVISLLTTLWAGHLRRHLMLYRIFSPRFMMGAAVTLVVDAVVALVAVAGVRWTMFSVGDTFTW
ncbi:mannose-ethanolamine phosphotransferase gpi13 [Ascosphaera acerosa]|nr:mannose-ethanolamine phosphotransferase gpi13 [Ascosphaera acerosa]